MTCRAVFLMTSLHVVSIICTYIKQNNCIATFQEPHRFAESCTPIPSRCRAIVTAGVRCQVALFFCCPRHNMCNDRPLLLAYITLPYHAQPYLLCPVISDLTLSYHILPYLNLPYLVYPTLRYSTLPYLILTYPTLS